MEPVPVTRGVRRTVRMAVALVVGQAMLCALIGWLTLGRQRAEPARPPGSAVVDQLAIPPLTSSSPSSSVRGALSATALSRTASAAPRRAAPARTTVAALPPPVVPTTRTPEPINAPPEDPKLVPPAPSPPGTQTPLTPRPSSTAPTASPSPEVVQEPVRVGDECRPLGAYGRTADGDLVRCVRDWRHGPRWKIV